MGNFLKEILWYIQQKKIHDPVEIAEKQESELNSMIYIAYVFLKSDKTFESNLNDTENSVSRGPFLESPGNLPRASAVSHPVSSR